MRNIIAIIRKEFFHFSVSPIAYAVTFFLMLIMGLHFFSIIKNSTTYNLQHSETYTPSAQVFAIPLITLLFVTIPALTMRSFSEENRSGTLELILTKPITDLQLVIGKWLSICFAILLLLTLMLAFPLLLSLITIQGIDWGLTLAIFLGIALISIASSAIGVTISIFFKNQIVSFLITLLIILIFWYIGSISRSTNPLFTFLKILDIQGHFFPTFYQGLVYIKDLIFFLSLTFLFLTFGVLKLDLKRWKG